MWLNLNAIQEQGDYCSRTLSASMTQRGAPPVGRKRQRLNFGCTKYYIALFHLLTLLSPTQAIIKAYLYLYAQHRMILTQSLASED